MYQPYLWGRSWPNIQSHTVAFTAALHLAAAAAAGPVFGRRLCIWLGPPLLAHRLCVLTGLPLLACRLCVLTGLPLLTRCLCIWLYPPLLTRRCHIMRYVTMSYTDIIPNMLYILYRYVYIIIPYHDNMPMYAYILCP